MKVLLRCQHCLADHEISEEKVNGKKGKFRCIRCRAHTPFSFVVTVSSIKTENQISKKEISFDLDFNQSIPDNYISGHLSGQSIESFNVYWFAKRVLFLPIHESDIINPKHFISITGISDAKKLKGLQFDIQPSDPPNLNRELNVSDIYKAHAAYRLSIFIEEDSPHEVIGKIYLAIPDSHNSYIFGSFHATKIIIVDFTIDSANKVVLPQNISHQLTSKVLLISGNIFDVQDSFNRLTEKEKSDIFLDLINVWRNDDTNEDQNLKFLQENILFEIPLFEKTLNEAIVFMIANQVIVEEIFWITLKKKIKSSPHKNESYIQILKKRYPKEIQEILDDISHRIVIPKDPVTMITRDDAESLAALLESGFSPNYVKDDEDSNPLGFSLLEEAVSGDGFHCAKLLLEAGADPNYQNTVGETAVFKLCQNSQMHLQDKLSILDTFISLGIDVNHQSENRMAALHWCALFGEPSLAKKLIQAGAIVDILDFNNNSSLHESCKFGHSAILALLLESGAKANLKNKDGKTGRDLALEELEIAELEGDEEKLGRYERIISLLDVYGG